MDQHPQQPLYSGFLYVKGDGLAIFGGHSWKRQFTTLSREGRLGFSHGPRDRILRHDCIQLGVRAYGVVPNEEYEHYFVIHSDSHAPRAFRAASSFALADLLGALAECVGSGGAPGCTLECGNLLRDNTALSLMSPGDDAEFLPGATRCSEAMTLVDINLRGATLMMSMRNQL